MLNVQALEHQLFAAENLKKPRLDFVSSYQMNGFGDNLNDAYDTLFDGEQTGWELGFQFAMPLGRRLEQTRIPNIRLRLAKARALLHEQEVEISHELASAYRELHRSWQDVDHARKQLEAARRRVAALEGQYHVNADANSLIAVAHGYQSRSDAEVAFTNAVVRYTEAQTEFRFRAGTLLDLNNIYLADDRCQIVWQAGNLATTVARNNPADRRQ